MINFGLIGAALITAVARGLVGWLKPALADGKIDAFEWKKLAETLLVVTISTAVVFVPSEYLGGADPELYALIAALLINELWNAWRGKTTAIKKKK